MSKEVLLDVETLRRMMAAYPEPPPVATLVFHSEHVREMEKTLGPIETWGILTVDDGEGGRRRVRCWESKLIQLDAGYIFGFPVVTCEKARDRLFLDRGRAS